MNPDDFAVLELSSFQLMTMKKSPPCAVVTNITPNHLDMHLDMDEYVEAKRNILRCQTGGDTVVLNFDNDITRSFADTAKANVRLFSRETSVQKRCLFRRGHYFYSSGRKS